MIHRTFGFVQDRELPSLVARCRQWPHCLCGSGKVICHGSARPYHIRTRPPRREGK